MNSVENTLSNKKTSLGQLSCFSSRGRNCIVNDLKREPKVRMNPTVKQTP